MASTADIKESEMNIVDASSVAYLRVLTTEGNSKLVSMKSVLQEGFYNYRIIDNQDADTLTNSGWYYLRNGITNADGWSLMLVINFGWDSAVLQLLTPIAGGSLKLRTRNGTTDNAFGSWFTIS